MTFAMKRFDRAWRRIAVVSFLLAIATPLAVLVGFRYIGTSSVPKGLWFVHSGQITRGAYVFSCLPVSIASIGKRAGYLPTGLCPGRTLPVMKKVVAISGDRVAISARGIIVNGRLIEGSRRLERDSLGHPIVTAKISAPYVVPAGAIWLLGDWFKSWDSRYYGGVPASMVIGIGTPLITQPAGS